MRNILLIKRIKKNDMEVLIDWIDDRKTKLYKIGWAYLHSHHDLEDVFQNTILIVYEKIHQLRKPQYFETWVTTIFINECRAVYRKRQRIDETKVERYEDMSSSQTRIELFEGMNQLEEMFKNVIILKYIHDYSQEEIATLLQIPVGTVKSRLYRGLKLLRKEWERGEQNGL